METIFGTDVQKAVCQGTVNEALCDLLQFANYGQQFWLLENDSLYIHFPEKNTFSNKFIIVGYKNNGKKDLFLICMNDLIPRRKYGLQNLDNIQINGINLDEEYKDVLNHFLLKKQIKDVNDVKIFEYGNLFFDNERLVIYFQLLYKNPKIRKKHIYYIFRDVKFPVSLKFGHPWHI